MKQATDPDTRRELMERVENEQDRSGTEATGGVARPGAARAEEHRERREGDPPLSSLRAPGQRHAPDDDAAAAQDPQEARTEKARGRDLRDRPAGGRVAEHEDLDDQRQHLRARDDRGPDGREREAPDQARARRSALRL